MLSINYLVSKGLSAKYHYDPTDSKNTDQELQTSIFNFLNIDIIAGTGIICIGYISATDFFKGRRITLIALIIVINFILNIIWLSLSKIKDNDKQTELRMEIFDRVMYKIECALTFMVYQIILTVGPIDICKAHMLKNN